MILPTVPPRSRKRAIPARLLLLLLLTACGGGEPVGADPGVERPRVVATTSILGDVVTNLVGDEAEVDVLIPPGTDPHGFEPSAAQVAELRDAVLVVANGLGLEEGLVSALEAARDDGVPVVEVAEEVDPVPFAHLSAPEPSAVGERPLDPHVWFDPVRMAAAVDLLGAELASVLPTAGGEEWEQRTDRYRERLLEVDEELRRLFATIPDERRKLVTNHATFGYLADRYGFEVLGTVHPGTSPHAEPSPAALAELVEEVADAGVGVVFAEHTDSTELAEQLAAETEGRGAAGPEVVQVHTGALGEPGSGAETYVGLLRTTAETIAGALR